MSTRDTYRQAVHRACLLVGDESAFAARIGVPVERVLSWLLDESPVPTDVFLRVVDIVQASSEEEAADAPPLLRKPAKPRHP